MGEEIEKMGRVGPRKLIDSNIIERLRDTK